MRFESGPLPELPAETDAATSKDKDKKKSRITVPGLSPEGTRTPNNVISLEAYAAAKAAKAEAAQAEKPAAEKSENVFSKLAVEKEDDTAEYDKTVENLDTTERQVIAESYVEAVAPEVAAEVADAQDASVEQLEAAANLALLAELKTRLSAETPPEEALEGAYESVAHTLEMPAEAVEAGEADITAEDEAEMPIATTSAASESEAVEPTAMPTAESAADDTEDDEDNVSTTTPPVSSGSGTSTSPPPPSPPAPPMPTAGPGGGSGGGSGGGGGSHNAYASFANTPNVNVYNTYNTVVTSPSVAFERRHNSQAAGLLVGGILGYLIGRRRGRIKTERKLIPIQKKLEGQVKDLHEKISVKEQQIRTLAHQKAETETVARKRQEIVQHLKKEHAVPASAAAEKAKAAPAVLAAEAAAAARTAERPMSPMPTGEASQTAKAVSEAGTQKVEEMNLATLLVVAESITVDKQPLRKMYEAGQLDERSLRRAISEHVRGGNVHEIVAREMVAKELPFEADPAIRQQAAAASASAAAASVAAANDPTDRTVLPDPLQLNATTSSLHSDAHRSSTHESHMSSRSAITIIVVFALALAVVALII